MTPPEIFAVMNDEFNFSIDVCAGHENNLVSNYITEEENCLLCDWFAYGVKPGDYAWANVPYSGVMPFVKRFAEHSLNGVGCVMLVMMDQSVGWYAEAIKSCQEVHLVTGGRLSFINPETAKPTGGNNKGSMFLIWHPFAKGKLTVSHIDRDQMMAKGAEIIKRDLLMHVSF